MKVIQSACSIVFLIAVVTAQNRYRSTKSRKSSQRDQPVEQGRTFGALFGLGSRLGLGSGLTSLLGYDAPIAPYRPAIRPGVRPQSSQADPFYGGYGGYGSYGGYGGYPSNNYYGGYGYRPNYGFNGYNQQFGGYPGSSYGYRPQAYPGNYGGYGSYPSFNYQRPGFGGNSPQAAISSPGGSGISSGIGSSTPGSSGTNINPEQASQVANLLGQLLGSQLRPLVSGGGAGGTGSVRGVAPRDLVG